MSQLSGLRGIESSHKHQQGTGAHFSSQSVSSKALRHVSRSSESETPKDMALRLPQNEENGAKRRRPPLQIGSSVSNRSLQDDENWFWTMDNEKEVKKDLTFVKRVSVRMIFATLIVCIIGAGKVAWDVFMTSNELDKHGSRSERPVKTSFGRGAQIKVPEPVQANPVGSFVEPINNRVDKDLSEPAQRDLKLNEEAAVAVEQALTQTVQEIDTQRNDNEVKIEQLEAEKQALEAETVSNQAEPGKTSDSEDTIDVLELEQPGSGQQEEHTMEVRDESIEILQVVKQESSGPTSDQQQEQDSHVSSSKFKIEAHWFDASAAKLRFRKDYVSVIGKALKERGMFDSYVKKNGLMPPGVVPPGVSFVWGVHWENVFSDPGHSLPRHHRKGLGSTLTMYEAPMSSDDAFRKLSTNVTVNMIPGIVGELCSKIGLIRAKGSASEVYGAEWVTKVFKLDSFVLSKTNHENFEATCSGSWALKPFNSAEGTGVRIQGCSDPEKQERANMLKHHDWVAQQYVAQPFLTKDHLKFDLRTWMLITSTDPIRMYVVRDAHVRVASEPYDPSPSLFRHKCMHVTNGMVQKKCNKLDHHHSRASGPKLKGSEKHQQQANRTVDSIGSIWSEEFRNHILDTPNTGVTTDAIWTKIEDLMVRSVISVLPKLRSVGMQANFKAHGFQLLSFDIILDSDGVGQGPEPVVLEINPDGYLKKGFQRVPNGWACTKAIPSFFLEAQHPDIEDQNEAERVCRSSRDVRNAMPDHHECRKVLAHHFAETRAYSKSCWNLAFPVSSRANYLFSKPSRPIGSDRDQVISATLSP